MAPPTLQPQAQGQAPRGLVLLDLEPLTPSSFAPFGTAICPPLPASLNNVPTDIPKPLHAPHQPAPVFANQNSALKSSPISSFTNNYPLTPSPQPQMSLFSCFPRNLSGVGIDRQAIPPKCLFKVSVLERHPYTTQTFSPLGLSGADPSTAFLVVVAPTLTSTAAAATTSSGDAINIQNPPDLSRMKAFVAHGDQAVTYGPGTWHAPMAVVGQRRVDFVVTQFVNGVPDDDCQEVLLGENAVGLDLNLAGVDLAAALGRPKL